MFAVDPDLIVRYLLSQPAQTVTLRLARDMLYKESRLSLTTVPDPQSLM